MQDQEQDVKTYAQIAIDPLIPFDLLENLLALKHLAVLELIARRPMIGKHHIIKVIPAQGDFQDIGAAAVASQSHPQGVFIVHQIFAAGHYQKFTAA